MTQVQDDEPEAVGHDYSYAIQREVRAERSCRELRNGE